MTKEQDIGNTVPSNPNDRQKLKQMLAEMTHCLHRIDSEKESFKEIASEIQTQYNIQKKMVNKIARTMFKHNYADVHAENEHFEHLYESLVEGKSSTSNED